MEVEGLRRETERNFLRGDVEEGFGRNLEEKFYVIKLT